MAIQTQSMKIQSPKKCDGYYIPDFMRHICQEFTLTPIGQLSRFSGSRVLLDAVPQVENHLVDLRLQWIHFSAGFDSDKASEVAIHGCSRYLSKTSHLGRQIGSHGIDGKSAGGQETWWEYYNQRGSYARNLLPNTLDISNFSLNAEFALSSDFPRNFFHFCSKNSQLVDHVVDSVYQAQHLPGDRDASDFFC